MAPVSDAKRRADAKYRASKRKQLVIDYSVNEYENIKMYCQKKGIPMATWIKLLVAKEMRDDNCRQNLENCPQNDE